MLALALDGLERASRLDSIASRSGDAADLAIAALARGDCAPWQQIVVQRPALANWLAGPRSPVESLVDRACTGR